MSSFRLTVPGNLLLAGEYAVLDDGGLGLALAVEPRLVLTARSADEWSLEGRWPGGSESWSPGQDPAASFAGRVFLRALALLEGRGDHRGRAWARRVPPARLEVDTSALFDRQGRKRGFGSSAALAVALTAALARLQGRQDDGALRQIAVEAHREAQGGVGSGYDVLTSWAGGLGLFRGGDEPGWEPLDTAVLPPLAVFPGPELVRTVGSIGRYRAWQTASGRAARDFRERSDAAVGDLARAADPTARRAAWTLCRDLGLAVGEAIGSPAGLDLPAGWPAATFVKALGAGNETGLAADFGDGRPEPLPEGQAALVPAAEGLRWD